jgi:hypothetical protein
MGRLVQQRSDLLGVYQVMSVKKQIFIYFGEVVQ